MTTEDKYYVIKGSTLDNLLVINPEQIDFVSDKIVVSIGPIELEYPTPTFPLQVSMGATDSIKLKWKNEVVVTNYKNNKPYKYYGSDIIYASEQPIDSSYPDSKTMTLTSIETTQNITLTTNYTPTLTSQDGSVIITPTADGYDLIALGGGGGSGGTMNHAQLLNRDLENQHPISAINDLQKTLDTKQPTGDYALKSEIPDVSNFVLENDLSTVAKTGSYNDLTDTPEIPSTQGLATETYVENAVKGKQDILISGVTLKTVNNLSLLGPGNIDITGGGGSSDVTKAYVDQQDELLSNRIDGKTDEAYVDAQIATRQPVGAYIIDADYVHTDNNFTTAEKEKLNSLSNYNDSDVRQLIGDNSQEIANLALVKADRSEIPSITGLATEGYVNTAVSGKQDTLIAGANITITNNVISASSGGGSVDAVWGSITGTLSNQSDLKIALDGKQAIGDYALSSDIPDVSGLATKAEVQSVSAAIPTKTSDLTNDSGFLTSIPSDVVRDSDLSAVATSGSYNDLSDKPVIPTDTVTEAELQAVADSIPDTSSLATKTELSAKVDKVEGKGLSTNDFTSAEKTKLSGLANYNDTEVRGLIAGNASAISNKEDKPETVSVTSSTPSLALANNKIYDLENLISGLTLTSVDGCGEVYFATSSAFTPVNNSSYKWDGGSPSLEANKIYTMVYTNGTLFINGGV